MTKHYGVFVCIEGIDGSGKTTQAHRLVEFLRKLGYDSTYTTEPSKGVYGKIIHKHILHRDNRVPSIVEAVFFATDRLDHIKREIEPLLKQGKIIVCDRYLYSSIAYQGAANLDTEWIKKINKHALKPDLAIYIDIPPEILITRLKRRRKTVMETLENQRKVRDQYLKLVKQEQLIKIYGNTSKREVANVIQNLVLNFLQKHAKPPLHSQV